MTLLAFHVLMVMILIIELVHLPFFRKRDTTNDAEFQKESECTEDARSGYMGEARSYILGTEHMPGFHERKDVFALLCEAFAALFQYGFYIHN